MKDYEYIRNFNKITITSICKDLEIDIKNVLSGRAAKRTIQIVKNYLEFEIAMLYKNE